MEMMDEIVCGDAYQLIKRIPDKSIDCIVTDPPYLYDRKAADWFTAKGTKFLHGGNNGLNHIASEIRQDSLMDGIDRSILDEFCRVCKRINCLIFCNKGQLIDYLDYFVKGKKCMFEVLIWAKTNPIPLAHGSYLHDKEYILAFWESGAKRNVKCAADAHTVFVRPSAQQEKRCLAHPSVKPLDIVSTLVRSGTVAGGCARPLRRDGHHRRGVQGHGEALHMLREEREVGEGSQRPPLGQDEGEGLPGLRSGIDIRLKGE